MGAGGGSGRHGSAPDSSVAQPYVDLNRRISARVENLARPDFANRGGGHYGEKESRICRATKGSRPLAEKRKSDPSRSVQRGRVTNRERQSCDAKRAAILADVVGQYRSPLCMRGTYHDASASSSARVATAGSSAPKTAPMTATPAGRPPSLRAGVPPSSAIRSAVIPPSANTGSPAPARHAVPSDSAPRAAP